MNSPVYTDTSALAKLFLNESEGPALEEFLQTTQMTPVSSELTEVELVRAVAKVELSWIPRARKLLRGLILLPLTTSVRTAAGELFPGQIGSLDAIHLATAMEIKYDLAGMLTNDKRVAELAGQSGIKVLRPT